MQLETDYDQIYPPNVQIVYLINDFTQQRIETYLAYISVACFIGKEEPIIEEINQQIKVDLYQYLTQLLKSKPYNSLVTNKNYILEYVNTIIKLWMPSITDAIAAKAQTLSQQ